MNIDVAHQEHETSTKQVLKYQLRNKASLRMREQCVPGVPSDFSRIERLGTRPLRTPLPVPILKQLSARFLHCWKAARPCCCTADICHCSCLGRWRVLPKIEWIATGTCISQTIRLLLKDSHLTKPSQFHVLCQNVHARMPTNSVSKQKIKFYNTQKLELPA